MGNTITKLMNFRNTTLALTLAATTGAIKITSNDVLDDIGNAFGDAYDWSKGAVNDAGEWMGGAANDAYAWSVDATDDIGNWIEGAADDIANFAKDNQELLIGTGSAIATGGGLYLLGVPAAQGGGALLDVGEEELIEPLFDQGIVLDVDFGDLVDEKLPEIFSEETAEMAAEEVAEMAAEELLEELAMLAVAA